MPRVLRYFEKIDEKFAGEVVLQNLDLAVLQELFFVNSENPMYDSFPVNNQQGHILFALTGFNFEFERFDYFIEYEE
jgi:hypothetical protein